MRIGVGVGLNSRPFRPMRIGIGGMMIMFPSIIADTIARYGVYISVDKDNASRFFRIFRQRTRIKQSRYLIFDAMQIFEEATTKTIDQRWIHLQTQNIFTTVTN